MIRSPAGFDGEIRIKRYMDYYQASYGVMMLSSGQFGAGTAAGYLLGSEPSGYATDFTAGGVQGNALVRSSPRNTQMDYSGTPFLAQGGPVTFSRGSLATVTDSNGYIKWAPHNLLSQSEQLDAWARDGGLSVTANTTVAPNGTTTADTFTDTAVVGQQRVYKSVTVESGQLVTFGVYLKNGTRRYARVTLNNGDDAYVVADLQNGTITSWSAATWTVASSSISAVGNGWYYVTITASRASTTLYYGIVALCDAASITGNAYTYTGNGSTAFVWGAHLYRSDLGGMQANASAYPYYNPSTPKNLLGYSEDFSNAVWVAAKSGTAALGVKTNKYGLAPDNTMTAARIQLDVSAGASGAQSQVYQQFTSVNGGVYTRSAWIKTNDGSTKTIMGFQAGGATPNTLTVTGEWTRVSAVRTATGTADFLQLLLIKGTTSDTADLLVWRPQVSDSASLDAYSPVFGPAPSAAAYHGPRLDYDPVTLSARGLLVEEQRTNLITQSANFSASSAWGVGGITVSANVISAPDGTTSADKLIEDTSTGFHRTSQSVSITSGTTYTFSVYVKSAERTIINIQLGGGPFTFTLLQYNLSAGTSTGGTITPVGNGWYRCTASSLATSTGNGTVFVEVCDSSGQRSYTGNGFSGVYVWGAQLEAGAFATSYIPTAAASVTRNADVAFVATSQFPYSATEGTLVVNVTALGAPGGIAYPGLALLSTDASNKLGFYSDPSGSPITFAVVNGGASQASINSSVSAVNNIVKIAGAYKANDFAVSANGGTVQTDTSGSVPSATTMSIGTFDNIWNGHIRQITYIPRRLTNAELQARTA